MSARGRAGQAALGTLVLCSLALVLVASGQRTILVPQSAVRFPSWLAGPLHPLADGIAFRSDPTAIGMSVVLVAMALAYGVALACAPALPSRAVAGAIVLLHAIWLLAPLMPLTDVFNYLGYARLGGLHGLDPYTHGLAAMSHDPVFAFATWHHLPSPYGPLFTLASYALAPLPLPLAYWLLKLATVAASLGCVALLWRCLERMGRSPLRPVLLFAANPLVLVYGLGGFHNDYFMLVLSLGTVALLLARREAFAGGALVLAIAVKASAGILLPFALLGATRRGRFVLGAAGAAALLLGASWLAFRLALPNLGEQSTLLTSFSIPNALGLIGGLGGAPAWLARLVAAAMTAAVVLLALRVWQGRLTWIEAAGWATLALILSLSWLVPWYVMWLLPLAALAAHRRLTGSALVLSAYLLLTFLPATGMLLAAAHLRPQDTRIGRAEHARVVALQGLLPNGRERSARIPRPCGSTLSEARSRSIATMPSRSCPRPTN
jgi:hypothetical protein